MPARSNDSRILELARAILENTSKVDEELRNNDQPFPSFEEDGPRSLNLSKTSEQARIAAVDSSLELYDLLIGPDMNLRPVVDASSLQVIYLYKVPHKVPLNGEISFVDLAEKCNLRESDLRRLLRFAMVWYRVFQEKRPGYVSHSAASRLMVDEPDSFLCLGFMFDEVCHSFGKIAKTLPTAGGRQHATTAWNLSMETAKPMWEYYSEHPELGKRFAGAMGVLSRASGGGVEPLVAGYPWESIGKGHGTVVDVGGSVGQSSIAIAKKHPNLNFVVQDLASVIEAPEAQLPAEYKDRVRLMSHDFFEPQPVQADAYLFRQIFHNWTEEKGIDILRALVPALKHGAKIIVNDHLVPDPGTMTLERERAARNMDILMMSLFNSKDREEREWQELFNTADPRFQNVKVRLPEGASLAIVEATWLEDS